MAFSVEYLKDSDPEIRNTRVAYGSQIQIRDIKEIADVAFISAGTNCILLMSTASMRQK